ncbi:GNAT family N-acetyltransferase [Hymenobacter sp. PAMC 26628]|uniref:GNAT family N-acetyltransferase n=1 Tax=Hymenobacter sp. PAMC 26628 TaxID=1484118 RepID=UPI00077023C7|nr:GNAT family N-acetyltransferase [Hymenobacter sp. PAMC 26628]AMJ66653.1 hypothetical protein AXW84_15375 [Hymenobacter sp. PAMC 26628]
MLEPFESARLRYRPLGPPDAAGLFALDTDPAVHRYLGGIGGPRPARVADSLAAICAIQAQYAASGLGRWAVQLAATGEFMGWAGLKRVAGPVNGQHDFYDIGYRLLPRYWGQGYGYEAARAWLAQGFGALALPRVCAYADVDNAGSRRILEKIGLQFGNTFVENGTLCAWYEAPNPALA